MKWTPLLTLPMFVFMGYVMSESRLAEDLYRMFHVWFGPVPGGLAIGTILLMVMISVMNGLSVAGIVITSYSIHYTKLYDTTAVNAAVSPVMERYIGRLQHQLGGGHLKIMQSNGGS